MRILTNVLLAWAASLAFSLSAQSIVAGQLVVGAKPGHIEQVAETLESQGLQILEHSSIPDVMLVRVSPGEELLWSKLLPHEPGVLFAEPNHIGQGGLVPVSPNDSFFNQQWHLENNLFPGTDIGARNAWAITTGSPNVLIAVLDTGIDTDHPEFVGRIDPRGFDPVNSDMDPEADHPHGSQVSGVLVRELKQRVRDRRSRLALQNPSHQGSERIQPRNNSRPR